VIDDVEQNLAARHSPALSGNRPETHGFAQTRGRLRCAPRKQPVVRAPLRCRERLELRVRHDIARRESVLASLEVSLPDEIDDIAVVERADDAVEERGALSRGLIGRERSNRAQREIVGPALVSGEQPRPFGVQHRPSLAPQPEDGLTNIYRWSNVDRP
jgi:hypothetical protein